MKGSKRNRSQDVTVAEVDIATNDSKKHRTNSKKPATESPPFPSSSKRNNKSTTEEPHDYASKQYWEQRYDKKEIEHEWYYSFPILEPILTASRTFTATDKLLELGCGDRPLITDFTKFSIPESQLYGLDFSDVVINDLKKQNKQKQFQFVCMDARQLSFPSDSFDFIIEKGTIDAMLSTKKMQDGIQNAHRVVKEAIRVLTPGGGFVIVSHIRVYSDEFDVLMEEIILPALQTKVGMNWTIHAHSVSNKAQEEEEESESKYGTVYVITSVPKRQTRRSQDQLGTVSFEVFEYEDSDDDDDEEDGDEEEEEDDEFICMPCN